MCSSSLARRGLLPLLFFVFACLSSAASNVIPPRPITSSKQVTPAGAIGAAVSTAAPSPLIHDHGKHELAPPSRSSSAALKLAITARPTPTAHVTPPVAQNKTSIQLIAVAAQVQAQRLSASAVVKTLQRVNQEAPCPPTTRKAWQSSSEFLEPLTIKWRFRSFCVVFSNSPCLSPYSKFLLFLS